MPYIQLQFRRDSSINWSATNPLLASGEMGIELDTYTFKIGDGIRRWNDLPYGGLQGRSGPAGGPPIPPGIAGQVLTCTGPSPENIGWRNPSGNNVIIQAALANPGTNFNFYAATLSIPPIFGSTYTPGVVGNITPTDTTGFSILLNSRYNMQSLPIIMGTVAYWDGQKMNYMQIKFGNSSTTNTVRATITPTLPLTTVNVHNINTYGSPLTLTVDGISTTAFNGVTNISSTPPLNYGIAVFLELMN